MLKCIKFGDCKVKTIQIGNEWFVSVRHIGIALVVSSDALKDIIRNQYLSSISFQERKLILIALMMALNCSQQYLEPAESS